MRLSMRAIVLLAAIAALAAGAAGQGDAAPAAPAATPAPSSSSSTLDKLDDAVDKTKAGLEKAANFVSFCGEQGGEDEGAGRIDTRAPTIPLIPATHDTPPQLQTSSAVSEVKDAFNTTKATVTTGVNRVLDYMKNEPQVAEVGRLAAKPPAAVLAKWSATAEDVKAAAAAAPGTTGTVGDAAVAYDGAAPAGSSAPTARNSDVDVFSAGELGAAAATGSLQPLADGILAATASGGGDKLSTAVGKVVAASPNATVEGAAPGDLPPAAGLGAAFGLALREAPAAYVNRVGGTPGVPLRANATAVARAFIAGLQEAAIPCAASAGAGDVGANQAWFKAAAEKCCPVVNPALRSAQAAVDGDAAATRALYAALSASFELGGSQSFSLARCSTPDAKE
jgi:hypothetical protein